VSTTGECGRWWSRVGWSRTSEQQQATTSPASAHLDPPACSAACSTGLQYSMQCSLQYGLQYSQKHGWQHGLQYGLQYRLPYSLQCGLPSLSPHGLLSWVRVPAWTPVLWQAGVLLHQCTSRQLQVFVRVPCINSFHAPSTACGLCIILWFRVHSFGWHVRPPIVVLPMCTAVCHTPVSHEPALPARLGGKSWPALVKEEVSQLHSRWQSEAACLGCCQRATWQTCVSCVLCVMCACGLTICLYPCWLCAGVGCCRLAAACRSDEFLS
jgi:hypothetical protein